MASPEAPPPPPSSPPPPPLRPTSPPLCICPPHLLLAPSSPLFAHLSSAILGPHPSPTSYLNEWILSHSDHLPPDSPPPPLQHVILLPSLQLLSFLVTRPPSSPSPLYLYSDDEVTVILRDCRGKHVWRMRHCLARQSAEEEAQQPGPPPSSRHPTRPPAQPPDDVADDDRFFAAWQSYPTPSAAAPPPPPSSVAAAAATVSSPATASPLSSSLGNLRQAIVSAKASPFASAVTPSSSSSLRQSHWKALSSQPFSLFDASKDSDAWLSAQEATAEHSQYSRAIQQQLTLISAHTPAPTPSSPSPSALRPSLPPPSPLLDGFPQLHGLLHHLGFFSSLVPDATVLGPPPIGGTGASPSLMLLHASSALTAALNQLDMVEDARLCRVLVLWRREEQQHDVQMMRNCTQQRAAAAAEGGEEGEAELSFDSFVDGLASAPSASGSQLQLLVPARLCPTLLAPFPMPSSPSSSGDLGVPLFHHFLSSTSVRVVWCEVDSDYVPPHKQRRRDRKQRRQQKEREKRERKDAQPHDASGSERGPSYQSPASQSFVPTLPPAGSTAPVLSSSLVAFVYVVVAPQSDGLYRIRIDCDHRLRNRRREPLPVVSRTFSHTSPSSRVPAPLLRGHSLTNAHSPHTGTSPASSATMLKTLFKRLGGTGKRGRSNARGAAAKGRDDSLSPPRKDSSGVLGRQRSPRKDKGAGKEEEGKGSEEHRRRAAAARAVLRSHPVLSRAWPPEEVWVRGEEVVGKVREWVEGGVERVAAWMEVKGEERRKREEAVRRWKLARLRSGGEWSGDEEVEGDTVGVGGKVGGGVDGDLSARMRGLRGRLLRELAREHGEVCSPAALLAACFGSQHRTTAVQEGGQEHYQ